MSEEIIWELTFWFIYLFTGIAISFIYDFLRILRNLKKHTSLLVAAQDLSYWLFITCVLFRLLYQLNDGILRWCAVFGLFLGMLFYKKNFSDSYVDFMSTFLKEILHVVFSFVSPPLNLVKSAFIKAYKAITRQIYRLKKKLTGNIKKVNIVLCKRFDKNKLQKEHRKEK